MTQRSVARAILVLLGVSLCSWVLANDDLGAAAKKEKERRAKIAKPGKVLTEEDGKEASQRGSGSLTELTGAAAAAGSPETSAGPESLPDPKATWKARSVAAHAAVTAAEAKLAQLERDLSAYRSDMAPVSAAEAQDPMRRQKREARIVEMTKQIEVQNLAVAAAKKTLSDFEDEARRNRVPPGWLR